MPGAALLLTRHLERENKEGEMSLKERGKLRSNCQLGKLRGNFHSVFD